MYIIEAGRTLNTFFAVKVGSPAYVTWHDCLQKYCESNNGISSKGRQNTEHFICT